MVIEQGPTYETWQYIVLDHFVVMLIWFGYSDSIVHLEYVVFNYQIDCIEQYKFEYSS